MTTDLGDLTGLGVALGLLEPGGSPRGGWFADPARYLRTLLTDDAQRTALVETLDAMLGGSEVSRDDADRVWLPLFENPPVAVHVVLEDSGAAVHVGLGVRLMVPAAPGQVGLTAQAHVPLFTAGGSDVLLLGRDGATVEASLALSLPPSADTGAVRIDAVEASARVPTWGPPPRIGLTLRGLRLPGAPDGRDVVVEAGSVDDLDDALVDLVLGLVHAATRSLAATDPAHGLAGLLGLVDGDDVPPLPVAEVVARGPAALADWLALCLTGTARVSWLAHLATLLGGTVTGGGDRAAVRVPLGGGIDARVELRVTPGTTGLPVVTPRISVEAAGAAGTTLSFAVEPVTLDLATGAAVAVPWLSALASIRAEDGTLLGPVAGPGGLQITVGSFEGGFALDASRRPALVLAALDAVVGATAYDRLDLTDGDALAGAAAQAVTDAAAGLLDALGPLGDAVGVLLGLTDPPSGPAPRVDPVALLTDPIGAVGRRWQALLAGSAETVRSVLGVWQQATAAAALRSTPVTGDGTPATPYRVAVTEGVDLLLTRSDGTAPGSVVAVTLAAHLARPLALGAQVVADLRVGLLGADLAAPSARVGTGLVGVLALAGSGGTPLRLTADGYGLALDGVGVRVSWDPGSGAGVDPWLENPRLLLPGAERSLAGVGVGGPAALALPPPPPPDPLAWSPVLLAVLEDLVGSVVTAARRARTSAASPDDPVTSLLALASLTGWTVPLPGRVRLSLAELLADPGAELRRWTTALLATGGQSARLPETLLGLLARLLRVPLPGLGLDGVPWALALPGATLPAPPTTGGTSARFGIDVPSLAVALGPPTPDRLGSRAPSALVGWRPGEPGLPGDVLAEGISRDAEVDDVLADALAGRGPLAPGLDALVERWGGTDGVVALPDDLVPTGVTAHRPSELPHTTALDSPLMVDALSEVWEALGGTPARTVQIGVVAEGEPDLLPAPGSSSITRDVDLTLADAPVEAFAVPGPAPGGVTVLRLAGKAAAAASGAGDGFAGQVARLRRALQGLTATGTEIVVVAAGAAGRPAVQAAAGLPGVTAVVTVATPWTALSLDDVDVEPAAGALRMLRTLLDLADEDLAAESAGAPEDERAASLVDDEDLALARGLVGSLLARDGRGDPLTELSAPDLPVPDGLRVHALVGSCAPEAASRAVTAAVAAGLAGRSRRRVSEGPSAGTGAPGAAPARSRLGLHLPAGLGSAAAGLRVALGIDLDAVRLTGDGIGGPALRLRLRVAGDGRWLVGGPDAARAPGPRPLAVRALTLDLTLALPRWGTAGDGVGSGGSGDGVGSAGAVEGGGRLVLHDAVAFGIRRTRWAVDLSEAAPLLPEVRALLGDVATQLDADPDTAGLVTALRALGVMDPTGGFDATTLSTLLTDPAAVLTTATADASRAAALAAGLRAMVGDPRADAAHTVRLRSGTATVTVDLSARTLTVGAATELTAGGLRVGLDLVADRSGLTLAGTLAAGGDLSVAGPPAGALTATATLPVAADPTLVVTGTLRDPRGAHTVPLWPPTSATLDALTSLAPDAVAATALHAALGALRSTLTGLDSPLPAGLVDALLRAAGLLRGTGTTTHLTWPSGLLRDPAAWLGVTAGDPGAALPALVDAVAGLLPPTGTRPAGTLPLADGVGLRAAREGERTLVVLDVDATRFAGDPGDLLLRLSAGVSAASAGPVPARPELSVDVGADGVGALRVRLGPDAAGALGVTVSLLPEARPEIVLHPAARGLAGLTDAVAAGAVAALPALLTRLAAEDPPGGDPATTAPAVAGRVAARAGRALGLATGTPAVFDRTALAGFAADPAAALQARAAGLAAEGIALVVDAAQAVLGTSADRGVTSSAGRVAVTVGPPARRVVLGWSPGPGTVDVAVTATGLPGLHTLTGGVTVGAGGVDTVDVTVGPSPIAIGDTVTLAPHVRVAAGSTRPAPVVDLGLGTGGRTRLVARLTGSPGGVGATLLSSTGELSGTGDPATESSTPQDVALAAVATLLDLTGGVVLGIGEVQAALGRTALGTATVTDLLDGVLLTTGPPRLDTTLVEDLTDPQALLRRLAVLVANAADAMNAPLSIDGVLEVRVTATGPPTARLLGLTVAVTGDEWVLTPDSDLRVGLVTDAAWIDPTQPTGLTLQAVRLTDTSVEFAPGLVVGGLGVRFSRASGPLLDAGITVDALSLLGFGLVQSGGTGVQLGGGARVEIEGIGVPLGGGDGSNPVAEGLMPPADSDEDAPAPRFSPSLAVQKHPGRDLAVSLRAGPGSGPWWLAVQREFGPIYLEQIGFAVDQDGTRIRAVGVLVDGKVSLFGLSAAVDDLSFTYTVDGTGSPFDPTRWRVDVAGFAVTADLGGLSLAGGLRKFTPSAGGLEYLGMLMARLSVYGITVYGGFGQVGPPGDQYSSLFLFGAVNGPIGGPPAFFVTGIGGGFGANRALVVPSDLSQFGTYPLVKALDPRARPGDPFTELDQARGFFPAQRGQFWFAAGVSFTSFALVDGVVVVAVSFGNGFELNVLGLARMALPDESAALVSIELALVARVSTREGVVLVQAQLTDNSWVLAPAVRLTGGFAFASWFAGPNRGQFVLTLGGYHPDFHRDGYPVVPRLGLAWRIGSTVSVTGESYAALTSEALMAGMRVEIHASIGPAWAHLVFGADGIVFFDPFWLKVTIYASIDAGITIDLWFAEITISVHLSARLTVTGPPFRAVATFEIGPASVTFAIGPDRSVPSPITWARFVPKYLEEASPGIARALAAVTGAGTVPPAGGAGSGGDASPDGQPDRPFRVVAEFTATITSTVPLTGLVTGAATRTLSTSHVVSVAPMGEDGDAAPTLTLRLRHRLLSGTGAGGPDPADTDQITALASTPRTDGAYPIGAWGPPQDLADPKVPAGEVITATDRVELTAQARIPGAGPGETPPPAIPYRQVEIGARRVNPLLPGIEDATVGETLAGASTLHGTVEDARSRVGEGAGDTDVAAVLLATRGRRASLAVDAWRADLTTPVLLGSLGEGLSPPGPAVAVEARTPATVPARAPRPPRVLAVLATGEPRAPRAADQGDGTAVPVRGGTTVTDRLLRRVLDREPSSVPGLAPPTRADVGTGLDPALPARLVTTAPRAGRSGRTVVASGRPPETGSGSTGATTVAARAASPAVLSRLRARTDTLLAGQEQVADGQVLVLDLPDADTDTREERPRLGCRAGRVRAVLLGAAGRVLTDTVLLADHSVPVPTGTRCVVVVGGPGGTAPPGGQASGDGDPRWWISGGWSAPRPLPSASDGLLVAAGSVVDVLGAVPRRGAHPARVSWATPAELLGAPEGQARGVATTLAVPPADGVLAAVAVAVPGPGTDGLAIGLRGARQVGDLLVTADVSGAGIAVAALDAEPGTPVRVTVATDPRAPRDQLGVLAVAGTPEALREGGPRDAAAWLARAIATRGLGPSTTAPTVPGPGRSTLAWEVP